jgi:DNA-binding GntR family transcriptional regulator
MYYVYKIERMRIVRKEPAAEPAASKSGFRPLAAQSLSEQVADQIVEAIGSRRILPGQRLFEVEIAAEFSVSRVPVREALLVLQSQGVVRTTPRRGTHVIDLDELWARETYEARTALEALCCQRAAPVLRASPAAVAVLDGRIADLRAACRRRNKAAINRADLAFHSAIYEMAGSPLLQTLWNAMSRHVMIMFGLETYRHSNLDRIAEEHAELRDALLAGSAPGIAAAVARHVIGPFGSKTIGERAYETAVQPEKKRQTGGNTR